MAEQLTQANAPNWIAWLTDFDKARKTWLDSWLALKARVPWIEKNAPHLLAQHKAVMQKFLDQVPEIEKWETFRHNLLAGFAVIGVAITDAAKAVGGWIGLKEYDGNLGVGQVVTIAVGVGTAAALIFSMAEVAKQGFSQVTRVDAYKMALEKGASPDQAAAAVNAALGNPNDSQFMGLPIREALLAAVLIFLGPPLVKAITERKK